MQQLPTLKEIDGISGPVNLHWDSMQGNTELAITDLCVLSSNSTLPNEKL